MKPRRLISGPVLLGFAEAFDAAYGNPRSKSPYLTITPAAVGRSLLPFPCPNCGVAHCDAVDPRKRDGYRDAERGFSWCPSCGLRYKLDTKGAPLTAELEPGAESAPPLVNGMQLPPPDDADDYDALSLMGVD